jgi:hypothetical protein
VKRKLVFVFTLILCALVMIAISNPLYLPVDRIRKSLLADMPMGADIDEVREYIEKHEKWNNWGESGGYPGAMNDAIPYRYLRVHMGGYRFLFLIQTDVTVFWKFDKDNKLFELIVEKYYDGI